MKTTLRYRIETHRLGTYLRPLAHVPTIAWAIRRALEQQAELPGGKTVIHDTLTGGYCVWPSPAPATTACPDVNPVRAYHACIVGGAS